MRLAASGGRRSECHKFIPHRPDDVAVAKHWPADLCVHHTKSASQAWFRSDLVTRTGTAGQCFRAQRRHRSAGGDEFVALALRPPRMQPIASYIACSKRSRRHLSRAESSLSLSVGSPQFNSAQAGLDFPDCSAKQTGDVPRTAGKTISGQPELRSTRCS